MIKLRDHYYIAWLKVFKKYEIIFKDGFVFIDMTPKEYTKTLEEYANSLKPIFKEVRKTVKELAQYTSQHSKDL